MSTSHTGHLFSFIATIMYDIETLRSSVAPPDFLHYFILFFLLLFLCFWGCLLFFFFGCSQRAKAVHYHHHVYNVHHVLYWTVPYHSWFIGAYSRRSNSAPNCTITTIASVCLTLRHLIQNSFRWTSMHFERKEYRKNTFLKSNWNNNCIFF